MVRGCATVILLLAVDLEGIVSAYARRDAIAAAAAYQLKSITELQAC